MWYKINRQSSVARARYGVLRRQGFTLIELAVVLVIIGLIVGGVMAGRSMLEAANMRKDMSTVERITAAANTFKLKYSYLPGDLPSATNFGFDSASSGDGNGKIQGTTSSTLHSGVGNSEWLRVFHQLGKAGLFELDGNYNTSATSELVAGTYYPLQATQPTGSGHDSSGGYQPGIILSYETNNRVNAHYFRMGSARYQASGSFVGFLGGFRAAQAKIFDTKFDDGKPVTGTIQIGPITGICSDDVYDTSTGNCAQGGISTSGQWYHCALLSTEDYDTTYTPRSCSLRIKAQL